MPSRVVMAASICLASSFCQLEPGLDLRDGDILRTHTSSADACCNFCCNLGSAGIDAMSFETQESDQNCLCKSYSGTHEVVMNDRISARCPLTAVAVESTTMLKVLEESTRRPAAAAESAMVRVLEETTRRRRSSFVPLQNTSDGLDSKTNCDAAPYAYCCGVGTACWCNQDPPAGMGQCASVPKAFCCKFGTPCDCSKPPSSSGLTCTVIDSACDALFNKAVDSDAACTAEALGVAGACQIAGIGPEDPLADICSAVLGTTVEVACIAAVSAGSSFGKQQCKKALGCASVMSDNVIV